MSDAVILDASALIALLKEEKGADEVARHLPHATMSAVNWAEVASHLVARGLPADQAEPLLGELAIDIAAFDEAQALMAARLVPLTAAHGLSLGDRACLALAMKRGVPALTADKAWGKLALGVQIVLIR